MVYIFYYLIVKQIKFKDGKWRTTQARILRIPEGYVKISWNKQNNIGHGNWVTCMEVGEEEVDGETKEFLISGSRDKSLMIWDIVERKETDEEKEWGFPRKILKGK